MQRKSTERPKLMQDNYQEIPTQTNRARLLGMQKADSATILYRGGIRESHGSFFH